MDFMKKSFIVSFQYVSALTHPEHYCKAHGSHPAHPVEDVPEEHWTQVAVRHTNHPDSVHQFRGLKALAADGELIRAVTKRRSTDEQDPEDQEQPDQDQAVDGREHAGHQ